MTEKPHTLIVDKDFDPTDLGGAFDLEHHPDCPTDLFEDGEHSYTYYACGVASFIIQFGLDFFFAHIDDPTNGDGRREPLDPGTYLIEAWSEYAPPRPGGFGGEWDGGLRLVEPSEASTS